MVRKSTNTTPSYHAIHPTAARNAPGIWIAGEVALCSGRSTNHSNWFILFEEEVKSDARTDQEAESSWFGSGKAP